LRNWCIENDILTFLVSRERVLIYDNGYTGQTPLIDTKSDQLHQTWRYALPVLFADGEADVYVNNAFEQTFYVIGGVVATVISMLVGIVFFIFAVRKTVKYILLLRQEAVDMQGDYSKRFTEKGCDELTDLAKAMNRMNRALEEDESEKKAIKERQDKFIIGIAHDLRTPLTGLMGYLEICKKKKVADTDEENYIEKCLQKTRQIGDLFDKLMECFLSNTSAQCTLDTDSKVEIVLGDYLSEMCVIMSQKGFKTDVSDLTWQDTSININADYLWRIICNIESNIEKYGSPEEPIFLSTDYTEESVFLKIKNAKKVVTPEQQGTRIGLDNIKGMMLQMGGTMNVSENADSFTMILQFPRHQ
ncbi:MAG: HAMP domain-containing histidine kinase, partial [Lachnospiraceae bacterium]|nr:HAMP domain-containing histidine kinase [Lachnospiraceae bacterium]